MIEIAKNADGIRFYVLEHPFELDKLGMGDFTYFKKHLGMSDYMANFKSWLKRPTVYLIVAVQDNHIVGWSMNESWSKPSGDGRPVFVLRAIEISPLLSRKGLGRALFILISRILPGHMITKPVNTDAKKFFSSLNFSLPLKNYPVDLADHPGYLVLDEGTKLSLPLDNMGMVHDRTTACKMKMFPKETPSAHKESQIPVSANSYVVNRRKGADQPQNEIKSSAEPEKRDAVEEALQSDPFSSITEDVREGFIGNQKMLSSCECGENMAVKIRQDGKKPGTAFICASCKKERYFLPLKKNA
ncbi:MAG: hypothetical protein Q8J68_00355 [Methanolobus sp.]|uniref:hypothetical protein n=1 Tax=Methanolobus sp. TaxID=1874737 RepID=UPI00272EF6B2|nr:hypothetical protein [Methanolobus sp.]MDP2215733.1 hypothetical protein [Methanolobus sp.]